MSPYGVIRPQLVKTTTLHQTLVDGNDIISDSGSQNLATFCILYFHLVQFALMGCVNGRFGWLGMNGLPTKMWKPITCEMAFNYA